MIDFENLPPCFQKHLTNTIGHGDEAGAKMLWGNMSYQQQVHWINNDFYNAIITEDNKNNFNPAIVNVDHVKMPHSGGIDYIARVLYLTDKTSNNVMIVGNLILKCYSHKSNYKDLADLLYKHRLFQSVKSRWNIHGYAYVYEGSNKNNTTEMGSIILWKKCEQ